jgi:intermediate peptidase
MRSRAAGILQCFRCRFVFSTKRQIARDPIHSVRQASSHRNQGSLAATRLADAELDSLPTLSPIDHSTTSSDGDIREQFDSPSVASPTFPSSGIFTYTPLTSPTSLRPLTERTLIHGAALVSRIRLAPQDPSGRELRLVIKNFDRLSDLLCGVIDMCELIRNVHPDPRWVEEADLAYERLCSFMNGLNTDRELYEVRLYF